MANEITKLANLFDPEVVGNLIDKKLIDNIVFAPLADVDNTLVGRPGDILTMPFFYYAGAASDLSEGVAISTVSLNASTASVQVKEIGKGFLLTDNAILSGYGDPIGQAASQLTKAIADKVDIDLLAEMTSSIASTMTYETSSTTAPVGVADIASALELFGEDIDGAKALVCSPKLYTAIRATKDWCPASEFAADALVRGSVGRIFGCDIIVSNRLKGASAVAEKAFIVKPGALRLVMKRNVLVEFDRDVLLRGNVVTATMHYAPYLYNPAGAIMLQAES